MKKWAGWVKLLQPQERKNKSPLAESGGPPEDRRQSLGRRGEDLACDYLECLGFRIRERNYRVRWGEIDVIAEEGGELVFVEVKTRAGSSHGHPAEAVTLRKQQQLARVALFYLAKHAQELPARFDVVSVRLRRGRPPELELIRGAFELDSTT